MAAQKMSFRSPYCRLVYDIKYKINKYKLGHKTESILAENWKIAPTHLKYISWNTLKSVARSLKRKNRYRTVKAVHSQWHTVSRMCKWGQSDTHLCPLCKIHEETCDHVLQCPHQEIKSKWMVQLIEFRKLLEKFETFPLLTNRLLSSLQQWCGGFEPSTFPVPGDYGILLLNTAFVVQEAIGIGNLFRGLITWDLIKVQEWIMWNMSISVKTLLNDG